MTVHPHLNVRRGASVQEVQLQLQLNVRTVIIACEYDAVVVVAATAGLLVRARGRRVLLAGGSSWCG